MGYDKWHWQEIGKAWKGVGIYHVTLTVPSREPLLGRLVIPENDPKQAIVERTELGDRITEEALRINRYYPEIRVIQHCLMPDHLHVIYYVTESMDKSIKSVIRGLWQGVKKIGRAYTEQNKTPFIHSELNSEKTDGEKIFTEVPFIRPMSRRGQLNTMIHYVKMNPIRLATKILKPGFFYVHIPVHVRHKMEELARNGEDQALRDYMNGCVLDARQGAVMVSPFISKNEQRVLEVLIKEGHPIIYIASNGFRDYYKPTDLLFDAVAEGRALILAPTSYDPDKRYLSREDCIALNKIAEDLCLR